MPKGANRIEDGADDSAIRAPLRISVELEARLRACLDPLDDIDAAGRPGGSDLDLNPDLIAPQNGLQAAAVLILLVARDTGPAVLFTRRADHLRRHAGQIAFPGGRCEDGETSWGAALREAQEEVGLDPERVRLIGLSTPYRTLTGYRITPVVGILDAPEPLLLNPSEVAETFEAPFAFLMNPSNHERRHRDQPPGPPRWHYAITWQDWVIWGATAGMLHALHERLERADAG